MLIIKNDTSCLKPSLKQETIYIPNNIPFSIEWNRSPRLDDINSPKLDYLSINIFSYNRTPLLTFDEDKMIKRYLDSVSENFEPKLNHDNKIYQVFLENAIELTSDLIETLTNQYNKKDLIENYLTSVDRYKEYEFSLRKCYLEMQENIYNKLNEVVPSAIKTEEIQEIHLYNDIIFEAMREVEEYIFTEYILGYVLENEIKELENDYN